MKGPSPTRTRSAAPAAPAVRTAARTAASKVRLRTNRFMYHLVSAIVAMRPRRHPAIGPLLQFDDNRPHHRKHHEAREHLLGLHHLPGVDQEIAHAALARPADHLGCDDEDDGDAHAEVETREDAGDRGRNDDLELDLARAGA